MAPDKRLTIAGFVGMLTVAAGLVPAFAGDSTYGTVVEVKSADVIVLDTGQARYNVRIAGVESPGQGRVAEDGKRFVSNLVLGKKVQMRFEGKNKKGEMVGRILTTATAERAAVQDVGLEAVKAGMARRQQDYDYKYGEMGAAEKQARNARRGLWSAEEPKK